MNNDRAILYISNSAVNSAMDALMNHKKRETKQKFFRRMLVLWNRTIFPISCVSPAHFGYSDENIVVFYVFVKNFQWSQKQWRYCLFFSFYLEWTILRSNKVTILISLNWNGHGAIVKYTHCVCVCVCLHTRTLWTFINCQQNDNEVELRKKCPQTMADVSIFFPKRASYTPFEIDVIIAVTLFHILVKRHLNLAFVRYLICIVCFMEGVR